MIFPKIYRASREGTCLFNMNEASVYLNLTVQKVKTLLLQRGYTYKKLNIKSIFAILRNCITYAQYHRGAPLTLNPHLFDCSSFCVYAYSLAGLWLPRLSIQQSYYSMGEEISLSSNLEPLDLLFSKGYRNRYLEKPDEGIGHVALYTGKTFHTFIHAANKKRGIVEVSADSYLHKSGHKKVQRYLPTKKSELYVISHPKGIESSDDILWDIIKLT